MSVFDIDADGVVLFESTAEREAREARTEWNDLVPVARLPPEILAAIFVRCIPTSVIKLKSDLSWLNITRVSRAWRDIALACPDFWSTLVFHRPMWTPVMLERSKMASLIIRLNLKKEHAVPDGILLDHASRLGILEIPCGRGPASRMRQSRGARRAMHLESCAFPWDSGWFVGLTDLHLEKINLVQRPTMETFLGILASDSPITSLRLLGYLVFPSSAILDITLRGNYDQHQKTYKSLLTIFCRAPPELYDTLWFEQTATHFSCTITHSEHRECLACWNLWDIAVCGRHSLDRARAGSSRYLQREHIAPSRMDSLPPPPLYDVYEDVALNSTLLLWDTLGRSLHNVHTIHLHQTFPALWLEFCSRRHAHHRRQPPQLVLQYSDAAATYGQVWLTIAIEGCGWHPQTCVVRHAQAFSARVDLESMPSDHPPTCLSRLLALFWARRTGGAPIWGLTLEGCRNVSWYRLANFRLFADVDCEGWSEEDWENTGVEDLVCIRSYSINIFAEVAELVRKPRHED
ncbi:hypothetical protein R3P38DRAFT_3396120 [Favolaschia claudopus]|uniref:F-box domain-containing protein n=1 Tax=Favolaschia claudopus TaxID=2862362 RepID=A0AAW0BGP0_9AGAR